MNAWSAPKEAPLPRFSLDRRVTVLVLFLTIMVVGAVAISGIPQELIPAGFTNPSLSIFVPWVDAPPQEVEDKITRPLQEELATVRGLDGITSQSGSGRARAFLSFKQDTDMDVAYREVRDRLERARRQFPDDVEQVFIFKQDTSGIPLFVAGVAVDPDLSNSYDLLQDEIILPLERTDGVASVEAQGLEEKEILIELNRDRVAASGLNLFQLVQELADDNFTMASGDVRDGAQKLLLRSMARYRSLDELENRLVSPTIRLRDVGTVTYEEPDKRYRVRAMSKPAYAIVVFKEGDANARDVSARVQKVFDSFAGNPRLRGVESVVLFSQGAVIDDSLSTLLQSGMVGGVIAALVLFVFLRRSRLTMVISLSIPLSLLVALTVMYFAGETLNILSLLALMVSVGLLVDNSVVVAENIHRMRQNGLSRRDACIQGAGEIALAITMSTLTTIVVFLPVALVEGQGQFFLIRLALPISVALLASLLVALVFVPLAVYLTLDAGVDSSRPGHGRLYGYLTAMVRGVYNMTFQRLENIYIRLLEFFLERRLDMILLLLLIFGLTIGAARQNISFVNVQEDEEAGFEIGVEMPENTTLEETEAWFLAAEAQVETHAKELGLEGWFLFHRKINGEIQGWFTNPRSTALTPRQVNARVLELLPPKPGMQLFTGDEDQIDSGSGEGTYLVTINGENPEELKRIADGLRNVLQGVDGVIGVRKGNDETPNEMGLVVDRRRAERYQVSSQVIAGVVGTALRGITLPRYLQDGREIPVRARFREEDRNGVEEIQSFVVPTASGEFLPLSSVTDVSMLAASETILRRDKRIAQTISLELAEGEEKETRERLDAIIAGVDLPEGIAFGARSRRNQDDDDFAGLQFAGSLSIIFIYLLMGFLFESFMLPLSIILTIPLAAIGVIWAHIISGRDIDFLGAVGIVLLIGVVVNNGIVLIDYVNRLRAEGRARSEAILLAAQRRFRPIMMTAITTIGGLVPLAMAGRSNSSGISYTSFSLTLIGGMSTATLLTMLVVPMFYTMFDDLRGTFAALMARLTSARRRAPQQAPTAP